ncbi:hypothetical protein ABLE91_20080 [Aquabacter sp. CN5-332]|uniref:hypothetical protein n=1 Tax=Aquabacter sp. CN5-332 TaxID=3156608 RepID=UPI0032B3E274
MRPSILRLLAWCLIAAIFLATDGPIALRPISGVSPDLERLSAFAAAGLLFTLAYPRRLHFILPGLLIAAGCFEILQVVVASRHAALSDVAIKATGVGVGVLLGLGASQCRRLARQSRDDT